MVGLNPVAGTSTSDIAPVSCKEFLHVQATTECRFTDKIIICSQIDSYCIKFQSKFMNLFF